MDVWITRDLLYEKAYGLWSGEPRLTRGIWNCDVGGHARSMLVSKTPFFGIKLKPGEGPIKRRLVLESDTPTRAEKALVGLVRRIEKEIEHDIDASLVGLEVYDVFARAVKLAREIEKRKGR